MANPSVVTCVAESYTSLATNISNGTFKILEFKAGYHFTYRMTGDAAPSGDDWKNIQRCDEKRAYVCTDPDAPIDVYVWVPSGVDGKVEVEV